MGWWCSANRRTPPPPPSPAVLPLLWLTLMTSILFCAAAGAASDRRNLSAVTGGVFWTVAKDDTDLVTDAEDVDAVDLIDGEGGFSTLDGMLQWAIGHSDPVKLKQAAVDTRSLSSVDLNKRSMEIKELLEKLKTPSDAQLMLIAINDLKNESLSVEGYNRALMELLTLVEPIDNANDFHKLGGLTAVIGKLMSPDQSTRRIAAWVIGKACSNNPVVQNQVLELGALPRLLEMVSSHYMDEAIKALYSVSSLVRNNLFGQRLFYDNDGQSLLEGILCNLTSDAMLLKKALLLVSDLAECLLENKGTYEPPFFGNPDLLKSVVSIASSPADTDLQEKALLALRNLLLLKSTDALVFKDACGLEGALEKMKARFAEMMVADLDSGFIHDLERLRHEVKLIFIDKLVKSAGSDSGFQNYHAEGMK